MKTTHEIIHSNNPNISKRERELLQDAAKHLTEEELLDLIASPVKQQDKLCSPREAAELIGVTEKVLSIWRATSERTHELTGPRWLAFEAGGRVYVAYSMRDMLDFMKSAMYVPAVCAAEDTHYTKSGSSPPASAGKGGAA